MISNMTRKAYSYIRMSTDTQLKGDSLRRQLEASKEYAEKNDLELVESIDGIALKDIGVSGFRGKNTREGVLAVFLDALDRGKITPDSVLLIESLDRLSRDSLTKALTQFITILEKGVEIITLADNQKYTQESINTNPGSIFVSLGIMYRANEESETKSKRLRSVWNNKRANINTKVLTRTCPAWLKYNETTGKFDIIEERGEIVKKIFDLCTNSCGLFGVARYLNENKVPVFGKGKLWYISYVKKIIINRAVIGELTPHMLVNGKREKNGDPITGYFPKVISEETYLQAQVAIARRTTLGKGRKGTSFSNLFAGITYCAECGFKMMVRGRGDSRGGAKYLVCSNKLVNAGCQNTEWNLADFEAVVLNHLREINFADLMVNPSDDKKMSLDDQADVLGEKIRVKEIEIDRAADLMISSDLSDSVKSRITQKLNTMEIEVADLQKQLAEKRIEIAAAASMKNEFSGTGLKTFLEELDAHQDDYMYRSTVNNLLMKLIDRVELKDGDREFKPWEYEEDDQVIAKYRKAFKGRKNMPLSKILSNADFVTFSRNYEREISIKYRSGAVRHLMAGMNASIQVKKAKNPSKE